MPLSFGGLHSQQAMAKERIHSAPVWVEQPERGYTQVQCADGEVALVHDGSDRCLSAIQVDVQDLAAALFSLHGNDVESVKNSFFQRQVLSVASTLPPRFTAMGLRGRTLKFILRSGAARPDAACHVGHQGGRCTLGHGQHRSSCRRG